MKGRSGTVLLVLLAGAALGGDPPRAGIPRTAEFQSKVDAAIDRGVAWLRTAQEKGGSYPEYTEYAGATTALAYHTLRACGVPRDDPTAQRAWEAARRAYSREKIRVYSAVLFLLAISSHGEPVAKAAGDRDVRLSNEDAKWARELAAGIASAQNGEGLFSYYIRGGLPIGRAGPSAVYFGDNSNTQYALLGLKHTARCGVPVDTSVWKRALKHFLNTQEKTGPRVTRTVGDASRGGEPQDEANDAPVSDQARGWNYGPNPELGLKVAPYTSMTAGGVSSVIICRSELAITRDLPSKLDAECERAVWDGIAWLGRNWSPRTLEELRRSKSMPDVRGLMGGGLDLYEYFGIERAGVLADVDWMAGLDWYGAGADVIVAAQEKDGSWTRRGATESPSSIDAAPSVVLQEASAVVDACFALLFLRRGTAPVSRGALTKSGADDINFAVARKLDGKHFDDFLDLVLDRWSRTADKGVKIRLFDGTTSAGPRIVDPLLARMASVDAGVRTAAHALLRHATRYDFGYAGDAAADTRNAALAKWRAWWTDFRERVVYDETSRKLVVR